MRRHPLKGDRGFHAELTQYITTGDDPLVPWWVTLSRHNLERSAPEVETTERHDGELVREDLTALNFVTIDSASTEDMDDALYVQDNDDGSLQLTIAIADPTAYVDAGSELDNIARQRAFTNYLPGFNIPMLRVHCRTISVPCSRTNVAPSSPAARRLPPTVHWVAISTSLLPGSNPKPN